MKKIYTLFIATLISTTANAVTNIEFVRDKSVGKEFYAQIEGNLNGESGNQQTDTIGASISLAWDDNGSHFITVFDHLWRKDTGNVEVNQSFAHIRYTKEFKNSTGHHLEMFVQGQRDRFRNLESRVLFGLGHRKEFYNEFNKRSNAFGVGAFYESEEGYNLGSDFDEKQWRLNAYWHHKQPITESVSVNNVIYFQPDISEFTEYRIHNEFRLTAEVTKSLSYGFSFTYSFNSDPLGDVKRYDMNYGSFLQYSF